MKIIFSKANIEITPAMHEYAEKRLGRLERHLPDISSVELTVKKQTNTFVADALVHNERAGIAQVHAHAQSENYYATIDSLESKLIRQLEKLKEKQNSQRHH